MQDQAKAQPTAQNLDRQLGKFRGGEIEIQNPDEGYVYRGIIESAGIVNNELKVVVSRFAQMTEPGKWIEVRAEPYSASLEIYSHSDIGQGRLAFQSAIIGELTVLFPPGGSRLDWSKVVKA